jgi:hypothetical protein
MSKSKWVPLGLALVVLGAIVVSNNGASTPAPVDQMGGGVPESWLVRDGEVATFRYPQSLETEYIGNIDWPPRLQVLAEQYTCTEAGLETERAGVTREVEVEGTKYCVTEVSDAAAGSKYTQYAYAREFGEKTVILTFSLRFSQCANYTDEEKLKCEVEREMFNISSTIHEIAETIKLK